ncbi:hypothetical protein [Dyella sp. C9]|uniref:hypothetical protein n=1 Tax=Dyella sp. C9 TaxID=2202154 RepID=UPI001E5CFAF3|nr:hypothetical protein [Dyella sp. C9]
MLRLAIALEMAARQPWHVDDWQLALVVLLGLAIVLGVMTSIAGMVLLGLFAWSGLTTAALSPAMLGPCLQIVALILLGPGAYSLDARLFGRRTIELPPP